MGSASFADIVEITYVGCVQYLREFFCGFQVLVAWASIGIVLRVVSWMIVEDHYDVASASVGCVEDGIDRDQLHLGPIRSFVCPEVHCPSIS